MNGNHTFATYLNIDIKITDLYDNVIFLATLNKLIESIKINFV